jgi:RHS repeat-associated protein
MPPYDPRRKALPSHLVCPIVWGLLIGAFVLSGGSDAAEIEQRPAGLDRNQPDSGRLEFSASPQPEEFFRARIFQEPLVPFGVEPAATENADLAKALTGYSQRSGPDDFSSLTAFLRAHPDSPWAPALLTDLGLEYYNTAHYSLALEAWEKAWTLAKGATDLKAKAVADRAIGELAYMYARLGRMTELDELLQSVKDRVFIGSATEKIAGAREGLWNMQNRPEISFRCGPLALHRIKLATDPQNPGTSEILKSASTQKGMSLPQLADLSRKVGLNYQMAFREAGGEFTLPSVVHWKVGHYAAMVRREKDRYLLEDPTFGNTVWATRQALESETSGYFLVPSNALPAGWRAVDRAEGDSIWGKGNTALNDNKCTTPHDPHTATQPCSFNQPAMAVPCILLMLVSLNIVDAPVGYNPAVGPSASFTVRYNHRDAYQPANFTYSNFGPKWTSDWISYITDNPQDPQADVFYYARGGGTRSFPKFGGIAFEKYDQTELVRLGSSSYELISRDGSKLLFDKSDGSTGTSRKVFMTKVVDPYGNVLSVNYDSNLRMTSIVDAIGQSTTLEYGLGSDIYKITKVTDPFGRFATFDYDGSGRLIKITDVIGITSQFNYQGSGDFINSLVTPYGTTFFTSADSGNTRVLEALYPDNSRERVEYNQGITIVPMKLLVASVPVGMNTHNDFLQYRNTYYWSRAACAIGYGDYTKARLYHWLHTEDLSSTAGALESVKEPLEGRVWYDYAGQSDPIILGNNNRPIHIGRVLDDGSSQIYTYSYDSFGHVTTEIDPVGRKLSFIYSTNGIDLVEVHQTRAGKSELLASMTYNPQHLMLTRTDAAGQTSTFTYNARGQILTITDPKHQTTALSYNPFGYLLSMDGPLPGTADAITTTYDSAGRPRSITGQNAYAITLDYDDADRVVKTTYPDGSFKQYTYDRLDISTVRDRAGRLIFLDHDSMRQLTRMTDPLGRVTTFEWCSCGDPKSMTDPMGRTTQWSKDVQGRRIGKQFGDGSQVRYFYESSSGRLQRILDEKNQTTQYAYNRDNTIRSITYLNAAVATPSVSYAYDPDYMRLTSITDGSGTTVYAYNPITSPPSLGAGALFSVDGPLPNDAVTYGYDELGRPIYRSIGGVGASIAFDTAGRIVAKTNALGAFHFTYDASSLLLTSKALPNGQTTEWGFFGNLQDLALQRITHRLGATPISEFIYGQDVDAGRITTWSQQASAQVPVGFSFAYDPANQLVSASLTNAGVLVGQFAYTYDGGGNRLSEQVGSSNYVATYNALNQISTTTAPGTVRTNEWDAANRLTAVIFGNQRTEFSYDGQNRVVGIRKLVSGIEVSNRRLVWSGREICEERDTSGAVTKRLFRQGVKLESGPNAGVYFYTRDHLASIRELTDANGNVRARYTYDPYGRRTRVAGDLDADFGFAGMFWSSEANLALAHFRVYDPELGRWLSRDPLVNAELREGPNLYAYVNNDPVNTTDPEGLGFDSLTAGVVSTCAANPAECGAIMGLLYQGANYGAQLVSRAAPIVDAIGPAVAECKTVLEPAVTFLDEAAGTLTARLQNLVMRAPDAYQRLQAWFADPGDLVNNTVMNLKNFYTLPPDSVLEFQEEVSALAQALAANMGVSYAQAYSYICTVIGFNPLSGGAP